MDISVALVDIEHLTKLIQPFHIHVTDGSQVPPARCLDMHWRVLWLGLCSLE